MRTVYIDGDSTTFGCMDLEMGGWPNRLHVMTLNEATGFDDANIIANRSMPGRTLSGILREAEANMKYFQQYSAFITAVLQAGMNEVKIFRGARSPLVSARLFGEQVTRFCNIAYAQDCAPVLVGPPPIDTSQHHPTLSGAVIKDELLIEYGEVMRRVAEVTGTTYVDTRAVFAATDRPVQELLAPDGYHPNASGHAALAEAVNDALPSFDLL